MTLESSIPPFRPRPKDVVLTALPYHLWANRAPGSMQVWIAEGID